MSRVDTDRTVADENAEIARLRAELDALKADRARSQRQPGFYVKPVKRKKTVVKDGQKTEVDIENPARFQADRILPDRSVVSLYVGANGKLTVGGHYGTYGVTAWADDEAVWDYMADTGPEGFAADRERIRATGLWADRPAAE